MSAAPARPKPASSMPTKLTTDDLRHKALAVRDVTTDEARKLVKTNTVRIVVASAVVVAVVVSAAYYFGSRSGARAAKRR